MNEGHRTTAPQIPPAQLSASMLAMLSKVLLTRCNDRSCPHEEVMPLTLPLLAEAGGFLPELTGITQNEAIICLIDICTRSSYDIGPLNQNDDFLANTTDTEKFSIISRREGTLAGTAWLRLL